MQTETGNRYAITALKDKRATLAGEIAQLKNKLAWAESQLKHLDATLQIFEPGANPDAIPNKRPKKRVKLFRQGELSRTLLDCLRTSDSPMRTYDVVSAVIIALGHEEVSRSALAPRVRSNLQYLQKRGGVAKIGGGTNARWKLAG